MGAIINGIGIYNPDLILTNQDLAQKVETSDEWITSRTGIKERRVVPPESTLLASDLGVLAARQALENSSVGPGEIDGIICAAINPDKKFPATACFIQQKMGLGGFAFDVTAACAGFVYAVNMAALLIDSGQCRNILVVGTELLSRVVDWQDRNTCILFGDAAGAVVMSHTEEPGRGVLNSILKSDGSASEILTLDHPGPVNPAPGIQMEGKKVFKMATTTLVEVVEASLQKEGLTPQDIDLAVFHQANIRILNHVADKLKLSEDQVIINVQKYGNTSSASIPLALYEAAQSGRLKPGMLVVFAAIGGGMSWGCNLIRW